MADLMKILQQAQEMQGRFQKIQDELQRITVSGSAGGGMVTAVFSGTGEIRSIEINPEVVDPDDVEMLQDLVVTAVREALDKAKIAYASAESTMIPTTTVRLVGKEAAQVLRLVERLEEHDDVQNVHANFDIPEHEMEAATR